MAYITLRGPMPRYEIVEQDRCELVSVLQPRDVAAAGQGDPLDRGQCLFERVDGPAGTRVIGAVDDQHRNGELAAFSDQVVLVPCLLELGVDHGVAFVADPEPRRRHLPGTG